MLDPTDQDLLQSAELVVAPGLREAGAIEGGVERLQRWIDAGVRHFCLRFAGGDQLAQVDETASRLLPRLRRV